MGTRGMPPKPHAAAATATPAPEVAPTPAPAPAAPDPAAAPAPAPAAEQVAAAPAADDTSASAPAAGEAAPAPSDAPAPEPNAEPAAVAAATPASAALVAHEALAQNTEPATIRVDIAASPAGAQLSIDGERVTNPFEARAPKGGRHRVLAEAPGHRTRDLTLEYNRDQHLDIKLERLAAAKRPATPAPAARTRAAAAPAHRSQPSAPSAAPKGAGFVSESPY
jgi:hypothetical protein